jgi:hypothetical protein
MPICSFCGAQQPEGTTFCDECGRSLQDSPAGRHAPPAGASGTEGRTVVASSVCPSCGVQAAPMDSFCANCGAPLKGPGAGSPPRPRSSEHPASIGPVERDPAPPMVTPELATWQPVPAQRPIAEAPAARRRCAYCGAELSPESAFCEVCGAAVKASPEPDAAGLLPGSTGAPAPDVSPVEPQPDMPRSASQIPPIAAEPVGSELAGALPDSPDRDLSVPLDASHADLPPNKVLARIIHPVSDIGLALPVGRSDATLGRDDPVRGVYPDLDLTDYGGPVGGVSRLHARISVVASESAGGFKFYVEDLDSVNGTFVNETKLSPGTRRQLKDGDALRLGRVTVVFQISHPEAGF